MDWKCKTCAHKSEDGSIVNLYSKTLNGDHCYDCHNYDKYKPSDVATQNETTTSWRANSVGHYSSDTQAITKCFLLSMETTNEELYLTIADLLKKETTK